MVTYDVFIDAVHAAMPSGHYEELSFANVGGNNFADSFVALSDGFIFISCTSASNADTRFSICSISAPEIVIASTTSPGDGGGNPRSFSTFIPVSKGITVNYSANYVSVPRAFFIYSNGSVPTNLNP